MDKHEFNIKVEQIKKMANKGDYETAMKIADGIDWHRVRNASLLSLIAQIYEKNENYQDAKDILLMAFERAPVGKRLLYKLTDLALKEGSISEAEAYYREFCDLAQDDPRQYLLRYLILKAKGAPVDQLIRSLETYTAVEVDEKWLYELAELYHRANMETECVHTCDRIMLLFGLGQYVDKAMDLKIQYAPLSKYQMDLVENRDKYEAKLKAVEEEYSGSPSYRRGGGGSYGQEAYDAEPYGEEQTPGTRYGKGQYVNDDYARQPYQQAPYAAEPYSQENYAREPYGRGGYTGEGYYQDGYAQEAGTNGYSNTMYGQNGYGNGTYNQNGYPGGTYGQDAYSKGAYPQNGYPGGTYGQDGYENGVYPPAGNQGDTYGQNNYGGGVYDQNSPGGTYTENGNAGNEYSPNGYPDGAYARGGNTGNDYDLGGYAGEGYNQNAYADGTYVREGYGQPPYADDTYGEGPYDPNGASDDPYAGQQYAQAGYAPDSYMEPGYDEEAYEGYAVNGTVGGDVVLRLHEDAETRKLAQEMSRISEENFYTPEEEADRYATRPLDDIRMIKEIRPTKRVLDAEAGREAARSSAGGAELERQRRAIQAAREREEMEIEALRRAEEEREKERRAEAERRARKQAEIDRERSQREEIHVTLPYEDEEPEMESVNQRPGNHLMIGAEIAGDGVEAAIEELRQIHRELGYKNPVAKISSEKLNQRGISAVAVKLAGKDLVIEQAADLTDAVQNELDDLMEKDRTGMIVVLIDTPQKLQFLHERNRSLADKFQYISADEKIGKKRITETIVEQALKKETQIQEKIARDVESTFPAEEPESVEAEPASSGQAVNVRPNSSEAETARPRLVPTGKKTEASSPELSGQEEEHPYTESPGQGTEASSPEKVSQEAEASVSEPSGQETGHSFPRASGQKAEAFSPELSGRKVEGWSVRGAESESQASTGREAKQRLDSVHPETVGLHPVSPEREGINSRSSLSEAESAKAQLAESGQEMPFFTSNDIGAEEFGAGLADTGAADERNFADFDDDALMDLDEFAQYARQYAADIDCSIEEKSFTALYERAEMMEEDGIPLTRQAAVDLIEAAADKAEKPSFGQKITGLFTPKYNKDGYLILREPHFFE